MPAAESSSLLYLSRAAVEATGIGMGGLIEAVEQAFADKAAGRARLHPKAAVPIAKGHFFQSMLGSVETLAVAGTKWVGVVAENPARGLPNVTALIVLSDLATGLPRAVMDGTWITAERTAAMSAAAAQRLARRDAATVAFIGCGVQAESHARALRFVRPGLEHALVVGRRAETRAAFVALLGAAGWSAAPCGDAGEALAAADIVVSTVPEAAGLVRFLDADRLLPGTLAIAVDLGRSWLPAGFAAFDAVLTDDIEQSTLVAAQGKLTAPNGFAGDLAALVTGAHPGRRDDAERLAFVFPGHVLGDLAAATAVLRRAEELGLGTRLPL